MDAPSRERQAELIAALLAALTPEDRFNLATCDVDCDWVFARPAAAEAKNIEMARQKLAARYSLGWTDLDKAMQSPCRMRAENASRLHWRRNRDHRRRRSRSALVERTLLRMPASTHLAPRDEPDRMESPPQIYLSRSERSTSTAPSTPSPSAAVSSRA